jgi:hypothetical protein
LNLSELQAFASSPYGAQLAGCNAELMLLSGWKSDLTKCGPSDLVKSRVGR